MRSANRPLDEILDGLGTMKMMIDLCSGFGGASQAFEESDEWTVRRFENNPDVIAHSSTPPTIRFDIMKPMRWSRFAGADLVWASPPCYEYTLGYEGPRGRHQRSGSKEPYEPCLALPKRCLEIIQRISPTYWVIENVVGSISFLEPILGPPRLIIGPFVLWGEFPLFNVDLPRNHKATADKRWSALRANHRAKIPGILSEGLRQVLSDQKVLGDF